MESLPLEWRERVAASLQSPRAVKDRTRGKTWHDIPKAFQSPALKFCEALAQVLTTQHEMDRIKRGFVACRQVFGREISRDRVRYVMDRATTDDAGLLQFNRPILYVDDAAFSDQPAARTGRPSRAA